MDLGQNTITDETFSLSKDDSTQFTSRRLRARMTDLEYVRGRADALEVRGDSTS